MAWFSLFGVPEPATSAPPAVADVGAQGTLPRYALENHTHASKLRKGKVAVQSNVTTYTWTFPNPFGAGVSPICNGIAETVAGVSDLINVQLDGPPTNTQVKFRITRYSQSFLSLLGINILGLNTTAIPITLHMTAMEP